MEKILLAIDSEKPNMAAIDFAAYLGRVTRSEVTGVFLENLVADERPVVRSLAGMRYVDWQTDVDSEIYLAKKTITEKNIGLFREACEKRAVGCKVHRDRGVPAKEIISESRFADILVIDAETSFNKRFEGAVTEFVKDTLKEAECPVIIAPESFDGVEEIIFTYDGTRSSAFAIRQFIHLFPQLKETRVIIVRANEKGQWADQDTHNFREWIQNHFSSITFEALEGDTETALLGYLIKRKNAFVVMGAYGRTAVSQFFKHSRADILIKTITQPLFIAHS